jgi:rhamnogalacturonan endolyase
MRKQLRKCFVAVAAMFLFIGVSFAQRQMENLNRGLIAFNQSSSVYLSWRLLGTEPSGIGFNVYCSTGGATAVKLNSTVITATTDYTHTGATVTSSLAYYIKPVINGVEQAASETYTLAANTPVRQYIPITLSPISDGTYSSDFVYVGDVDGDGDYDYIVKRFLQSTTDRKIVLDCYLNTGTLKWRMYMGRNIETGNANMSSPVLVYDFNGDGKAEVLLLTSEGTTFGNGTTIGDTNGDGVTDYNTHVYTDMYQVTKDNCPEFLSMVNGSTGAEMARTNFIPRNAKSTWSTWWGDNYGHRMSFIQATVAYIDGVTPSVVFSRGPGDKMDIVAWNFSNGSFAQNWSWTSRGKTFTSGTWWTDFHQVKAIDVDGDGKDEISWGSSMLDHNGTVKYTTPLVHGDRFQIGDFNPNRAGLEAYAIQQNNSTLLGAALFDANTGSFLKTWYTSAVSDIGRGDVADIDPNTIGMELFSFASGSLQSCTGADIATAHQYPDVSIWWDGDLCRENFKGIGSSGNNPAINKWNPSTLGEDRKFTIYNDGGSYVVTCPYAGRAPFIGDIIGDWREEVVLESSDRSQLRIYSTVNPAVRSIYTLMHNPAYRIDVTTKGYLCSKYPDYYLGTGMSTPPKPNIYIVGGANTYQIRNRATSLYIDGMGSTVNGSVCSQWTSSSSYNQQWLIVNVGSYVKLKNSVTGIYIDGMGLTTNGSTVCQWSSGNSYNQQWLMENVGSYVKFKNRATGLYLDGMGRTAAGSDLGQYASSASYNQQWSISSLKSAHAEESPEVAANDDITIYPNPAPKGMINIAFQGMNGNTSINIFDMSGKLVKTITTNETLVNVDMDVKPGVYIVKIVNGEKISQKKIIVQ